MRLLTVVPIPEPLRDWRDYVLVTTDQRIERLAISAADELRRLATIHLDGAPVETSGVFGDRVVARLLFAGQPLSELAVPRVWAPRPEPMM